MTENAPKRTQAVLARRGLDGGRDDRTGPLGPARREHSSVAELMELGGCGTRPSWRATGRWAMTSVRDVLDVLV